MPVKRYKGDKARADKLFSEIIRSLGYCEAEGWDGRPCSSQLQTAHIVTRKRSATRTDFHNAFCLCFAHHRYFTDYPRQFSSFISDSWASTYYETVFHKSTTPTKVDWALEVARLTPIKQAIDNGLTDLTEVRVKE